MIAWILRRMVRSAYRKINEGDYRRGLRLFADDATFVFPGDNSFAGRYHGKEAIEAWLQRLVTLGLHFDIEDVVVGGTPWNTRAVIVMTDHARDPDGEIVYRNRAVGYARGSWGKVRFYELYEDTEKASAFDRYLARGGQVAAVHRR